ncbi:MAG: ribosome maturation factor RimM [Caldimonas sp.]
MARDASATWPDDALEVGRIGEAWGLKGGFRVLAYADPPDALLAASHWHLRPAETPRRPAGAVVLPEILEIASVRASGDGLVASSPVVADRSAAEALRGARIFIARSQFPKPADDEFYWADLIGLAVVNRDGVGLGSVVGLIDTGPHSVLRIRPDGADADEVLIPFVSAYVDGVDLAARRIVVDWGLDF